MFTFSLTFAFLSLLTFVQHAHAHLAVFHKAMYCLNGLSGTEQNNNDPISPLFQLPFSQWWMHHVNGCDDHPPAPNTFLELPAGEDFTVEIADNQGHTTLSFDGQFTSEWPDGQQHPEDFNVPTCIGQPNMHTQNQSMAAGSAFAISYESDIKNVTPDNLVVFSVRYNTPWKRLTTFDVPAKMPACPDEGCTCVWGWVPFGCGEPNIYLQAFKCKVTGAQSDAPALATPKAPVYCKDDPSKCVQGAKQMIYWNQLEKNNLLMPGQKAGEVAGVGLEPSPGYNMGCGFPDGAQNDIFQPGGSANNPPSSSAPSSPSNTAPATSAVSESVPPVSVPTPAAGSGKQTCFKAKTKRAKRNLAKRGNASARRARGEETQQQTLATMKKIQKSFKAKKDHRRVWGRRKGLMR